MYALVRFSRFRCILFFSHERKPSHESAIGALSLLLNVDLQVLLVWVIISISLAWPNIKVVSNSLVHANRFACIHAIASCCCRACIFVNGCSCVAWRRKDFVVGVSVLGRLIDRRVWETDSAIWVGLKKCLHMTKPLSYTLILALPK